MMEISVLSIGTVGLAILAFALAYCSWSVLNWVWLRPKRLERLLREQGIKGTPYRFLYGDLKENERMLIESRSKPIGLFNSPVPRIYPFLVHSIDVYGKNSFTWIGPRPSLNIMKPEHIKEIFTKNFDFQKPRMNPFIRSIVSGVASYDGEKWATHRKIINPAFHQEKLKMMLPACYLSTRNMVTRWDELLSAEESVELDMYPELRNLTRDVISRAAFGSSFEEGRRIFELQEEQIEVAIKFLVNVYIPGWRFLPTKMNRKMKYVAEEVHSLLRGIIGKKEKTMRAGETTNNDLLGLLLESNTKEQRDNKGNKHVGLSIPDVIEECKLFYFAGQETTSVLLVWTMVLLSIHTQWQTQAREEVLRVIGKSGEPDLDGLNRLKIVTMILYEVMRLYPPAFAVSRFTHKLLKLGELTIPPGVELTVPILLIHRDKELWGENADEFNPERFSKGISKATKSQLAYLPFGGGPRICIGMNFALVEAKMVMAMILQRFSFKISPSYAHAPATAFTLHPQHGAQVVLHRS